tara:strand:+ start:528 stop:854 length:327 start_codon:yes stop_codon:yes gene_type:complete
VKIHLRILSLLVFTLIYSTAVCQKGSSTGSVFTEATTKNGKKVILNNDMTWRYADKQNGDSKTSLVRKRIIQKIDVAAWGMIKDLKIESLEKVTETLSKQCIVVLIHY